MAKFRDASFGPALQLAMIDMPKVYQVRPRPNIFQRVGHFFARPGPKPTRSEITYRGKYAPLMLPFTLQRIGEYREEPLDFETADLMRHHPVVKLGTVARAATPLTMLREAQVKCDDRIIAEFVKAVFLEEWLLRVAESSIMPSYVYGCAPHEKVWEDRTVRIVYTDDDGTEQVAWDGKALLYKKIKFVHPVTLDTFLLQEGTQDFAGFVQKPPSKRDGDAYVVNRDGIFQTTPRWGGKIMTQSEVKYMEPFKGVRLEERGGKVVMTAWLERVPWLCVAEFNREDIYSPLRNVRTVGIFVLVLGTMLIVLTVILTTNYLFSRLETKRRNIRFLDHQLQQSSRMASSMKLASGFLREVNETLSNMDLVLSWADELAQGDLSAEGSRRELRESLKEVKSEVIRARKATDKFLKSTQSSLPIIREVNLHDLLDELIELLGGELHFSSITVKREYRDPLPPVQSDPSQLRQVFQNLLVNAVTAIGQDGVITVTAQQAEDRVVVSVGDTGPGIPKERLEKIFDPLFTTKPDGTGLGLSIGAGVLKKLGGTISVKSELGKGSVFTVEIPTHFSPPEG